MFFNFQHPTQLCVISPASDTMATRTMTSSCSHLRAFSSPSAARAFLQLAPGRYLHSNRPLVLDFLLPSIPSAGLRHGYSGKAGSTKSQVHAKRTFTYSPRRQNTTAIYNPRQDDNGNDMHVEITPRASNVRFPCKFPQMKILTTSP